MIAPTTEASVSARLTAPRASKFHTVLPCQSPPRAVLIPRRFSASAIARTVVAPVASMSRTIGSKFAAKAAAPAASAAVPSARLGKVGPVAQFDPLGGLLDSQRHAGAFGDQAPLFLGERGIEVEHERVGICAELGDDEGDAAGHEVRNEGHTPRQTIQLCDLL